MKLTIRKKLLGLSLLAVVLPLIISAAIIYVIVTTRSQEESFRKMSSFSRVANGLFLSRRDEILAQVEQIHPTLVYYEYVRLFTEKKPETQPDMDKAAFVLENLKKKAKLDYVILTNPQGIVVFRTNNRASSGARLEDPMLEQVKEKPRCTPVRLAVTFLNEEGLKDAATKLNVKSALALQAAMPIKRDKELLGFLVVGDVLNNKNQLIDLFKNLVFEKDEMEAGSSTLYMRTETEDAALAIATNRASEGGRGLGAPIDKVIFDKVVKSGLEFTGPETIAGMSYVSSYIPLQNYKNEVVGVLAVSVKETWFRDFQNRIRNIIFIVIGIALFFSIVLTWFTAGRLTKPIEEITEAADKISLGELDISIQVRASGDEIEKLANSLERMRVSLKSAIERLRKR